MTIDPKTIKPGDMLKCYFGIGTVKSVVIDGNYTTINWQQNQAPVKIHSSNWPEVFKLA
jgi:hypothetical protein